VAAKKHQITPVVGFEETVSLDSEAVPLRSGNQCVAPDSARRIKLDNGKLGPRFPVDQRIVEGMTGAVTFRFAHWLPM